VDAKALTPRGLFDGKVHYEIPPFQRVGARNPIVASAG
jgi:hypothetical protein